MKKKAQARKNGEGNQMLSAALTYAAKGWPVFPCAARGKVPLTKRGHKDATLDAEIIRRWWGHWRNANVGLVTGRESGFFVLDVDGRGGKASLAALEQKHGELPLTMQSQTGGGGRHLFFKHPENGLRNSAGKLGEGLDIRAQGGYVIAPPSIHESGKCYTWGNENEPDECLPPEPVAPPTWLLNLLSPKEPIGQRKATNVRNPEAYAQTVLATELATLERATEGNRNDQLNRSAFLLGKLAARGWLDVGLAERALHAQALKIGLQPDEIKSTLRSGLNAAVNAGRCERVVSGGGTTSEKDGNGDGTSEQAAAGQLQEASPDGDLAAIAELSPPEYERVRKAEAKRLGMRVSALDDAVKKLRRDQSGKGPGQGKVIALKNPQPWPDPVDGAETLDELEETFQRYIAFSEGSAPAVALWVAHAHAIDAFEVSPILTLTSPERRCGKSSTLILIGATAPRPLPLSNTTAASTFRAIEEWQPTLLIDEADSFLIDDEALRGILNSGHWRGMAQVIRTQGDDHEVRAFATWGAKAIALIGKLRPTLADRSIQLPMRRKLAEERVDRLRLDRLHELEPLRRKLWRWANEHLDELGAADPDVPGELNDRQADNWRPLLAIADLVGGGWPEKARAASLLLSSKRGEEDSFAVQLLADVRRVFEELGSTRLRSQRIVNKLVAMEERPWPEFNHGKPISPRQLARHLRAFGVHPKMLRKGEKTGRGYERDALEDSFKRYLPPIVAGAETEEDFGL
jgi:hypothetical protein